jgi:hypothetical protein
MIEMQTRKKNLKKQSVPLLFPDGVPFTIAQQGNAEWGKNLGKEFPLRSCRNSIRMRTASRGNRAENRRETRA